MSRKPVFGPRPFGARDARVLLIADFDPNGVSTVIESIEAWQAHSRHEIMLFNMWPGREGRLALPATLDLSGFDGLIVHPTVSYSPAALAGIDADMARGLAAFDGVKVLMKQDEHVRSGLLAPYLRARGFDILFTCVPEGEREKVYPRAVVGELDIHASLTGYVTPAMRAGPSKATRDLDVSYRGSIQTLACGRLGYEKRAIGYDVEDMLAGGALRQDISSRWEDRVAGSDWDAFLARSRVVLGVESGSNIFDFDGEVEALCAAYHREHAGEDEAARAYYLRAHDEFLHRFEGNVDYAQISPRHLEAAAAGAAQMFYEGRYSDIFRPHAHYFPLRRDGSNRAEAIEFLRDETAQARMAERAFEEIILEKTLWYESFVARADAAIDARLALKRPSRPRGAHARRRAVVLASSDAPAEALRAARTLTSGYEVLLVELVPPPAPGAPSTAALDTLAPGLARLSAPREAGAGESLPTPRHLREGLGEARSWLAILDAYARAPDAALIERLGGHVGAPAEFDRFRGLCAAFAADAAAALAAVERAGLPDVVVAVGLPALFGAAALAQEGVALAYWASGRWPREQGDFQHWESEFWACAEMRLSALASCRVAAPETAAARLEDEYGLSFSPAPGDVWPISAPAPAHPRRRAPLEGDLAWLAGWAERPAPPTGPRAFAARVRRALARRIAPPGEAASR